MNSELSKQLSNISNSFKINLESILDLVYLQKSHYREISSQVKVKSILTLHSRGTVFKNVKTVY